jgi:hypothetical protein
LVEVVFLVLFYLAVVLCPAETSVKSQILSS